MARYAESLNLITLLDDLRETYELAKEARQSELQTRLMQVRRGLLEALHQSINLHAENAELQQQIAELRAENEQLKAAAEVPPRLANAVIISKLRNIS